MSQVEAIFRNGVFQPLGPVDLTEDEKVRLSFEPAPTETLHEWLSRVQQRREQIFRREGYVSNSALDIAEDRSR